MSFGTLVVNYPDKYLESVDLAQATLHLGSAYDNDVVLYDPGVAPYHAQLLCDESGYQVLDLSNGGETMLAGKHLDPQVAMPLDVDTPFRLGGVTLVVRKWAPGADAGTQAAGTTMGQLSVRYADGYTQAIDLPQATMHLGSAYDNDVVLYDPGVAPYHAQLLYDEGGFRLRDLGSISGTLLGGTRMDPLAATPLDADIPFQLGGVTLVVQGATAAALPVATARRQFLRTRQAWLLAAAGLVLVLVLAGGTWLRRSATTAQTATVTPSVSTQLEAVLPLPLQSLPVVSVPTDHPTALPTVRATSTGSAPTPTRGATSTAAASPTPASPRIFAVSTRGLGLYLRAAPAQNAPVVGKLEAGTVVRALEGPVSADGTSWMRVEGGGSTGWCAQQWLSPAQ